MLDETFHPYLISYFIGMLFIMLRIYFYKEDDKVARSLSSFGTFLSGIFFAWYAISAPASHNVLNMLSLLGIALSCFFLFAVSAGWWQEEKKTRNPFKFFLMPFYEELTTFFHVHKKFFFSEEEKVLFRELLYRVAYIDNEFNQDEVAFVNKKLREFDIETSDEPEEFQEANLGERLEKVYEALRNYFNLKPNKSKVEFLHDAIHKLIRSDKVITEEEALLLNEVDRLSTQKDTKRSANYELFLIPQNEGHVEKVRSMLPDVEEKPIFNATAYYVGFFYTLSYAEEIANFYRQEGLPAFVVSESERRQTNKK